MFSGCESADLCPNIDELEKNDRTKNKRERQKAFQGNSDASPTWFLTYEEGTEKPFLL